MRKAEERLGKRCWRRGEGGGVLHSLHVIVGEGVRGRRGATRLSGRRMTKHLTV